MVLGSLPNGSLPGSLPKMVLVLMVLFLMVLFLMVSPNLLISFTARLRLQNSRSVVLSHKEIQRITQAPRSRQAASYLDLTLMLQGQCRLTHSTASQGHEHRRSHVTLRARPDVCRAAAAQSYCRTQLGRRYGTANSERLI